VSPELRVEIERKYLLRELPRFPRVTTVLEIDQGYLPGDNLVERLRREESREGDVRYYRTVKIGSGIERHELEDETDQRTFDHLWLLTQGRRLRKRRYLVPNGDDVWEIDEFLDRPLVLAELELEHASERIEIPDWLNAVLVREVTEEKQYTNRSLAR
jgi:CYTH domain-containing protein